MNFEFIYILIIFIAFVEKTPSMCDSIDEEIKETEDQRLKAEKLVNLQFSNILNKTTDVKLKEEIKYSLINHILGEISKRRRLTKKIQDLEKEATTNLTILQLKLESNWTKKIQALENDAKTNLTILQLRMDTKLNATIDNSTRLLDDNAKLIYATLTREAFEQAELNAFPPGLYYSDLKRHEKWLIALKLYESPALNYIRGKLQKWNVTFEQFAEAAQIIHASISSTFSHPKLAHYKTPKDEKEIVKYCSFLNLLQKNEEEPESSFDTKALELACILAWRCCNYLRAGFSSDNDELTTHHIVIRSSKLLSLKDIENKFMTGIVKEETRLGKKLVFNKTVTVLHPLAENKKDPKATIHSNEKKYIFSLLCSIELDPDKLKNRIDQSLQKGFMHFNDVSSTSILKTDSTTTDPKDESSITSVKDDFSTSSEEDYITRGGFP